MRTLLWRLCNGYRPRKIKEWYYTTFYSHPGEYTVHYNDVTGPYRLVMRLADGPGMRQRLREGTEMTQRRIFLPLLGQGWVCCDVGAHVGDYTVEMALIVGPKGRIFAYEAVPHYFGLLQKSVKANGLSNVITKLAIVGANPGKAMIPSEMLTGNVARPGKIANHGSYQQEKPAMAEVSVVRLDDELDRLDAIKVDCEGYELEVLKGMASLIEKNPSLILFLEVHERQLRDVGSSLSELGMLLLMDYGFKVYQTSSKHCICSQNDLAVGNFERLKNTDEFVTRFHGT